MLSSINSFISLAYLNWSTWSSYAKCGQKMKTGEAVVGFFLSIIKCYLPGTNSIYIRDTLLCGLVLIY